VAQGICGVYSQRRERSVALSAFSKNGLADLVRRDVRPFVSPLGFVQKGMLFWREVNDVWQLVGFQKSVNSNRDETSFTVNLSVSSKRIRQFGGQPEKPHPDEYHWNQRLGFLMPQNDDVWWTVSATSTEVMAEVVRLLGQYGLPELERLSSDVGLRDLWLTGQSPGLTEESRLICLSTLVALLGPAEKLPSLKEQMQDIVDRRPTVGLVRHLQRLDRT
jgi:hypothetical protein